MRRTNRRLNASSMSLSSIKIMNSRTIPINRLMLAGHSKEGDYYFDTKKQSSEYLYTGSSPEHFYDQRYWQKLRSGKLTEALVKQ